MSAESLYATGTKKLEEYLVANQMRRSYARKIILKAICELEQPFQFDQLLESETVKKENISKSSIYNAIKFFIAARILHTVKKELEDEISYELTFLPSRKIKFVCTKCGRTVEFRDKGIDMSIRLHKYSNFEVRNYSVVIYGECKACRIIKDKTDEE